MDISNDQLAAVCREFGESNHEWDDSLCLETLFCSAHTCGLLGDTGIYQILDDDQDVFLVSVEVCSGLYVHSDAIRWSEVRPAREAGHEEGIRHVLAQLGQIATELRARFMMEVAEIVSGAVSPEQRADADVEGHAQPSIPCGLR